MKYVYILRSENYPQESYVGIADDLRQRLKDHNAGKSKHTSKFKPWLLETYVAFSNHKKAQEFENYLKTGSGQAFANKRLKS
jgi:predicted GIY-YIG superfamily endonuclease